MVSSASEAAFQVETSFLPGAPGNQRLMPSQLARSLDWNSPLSMRSPKRSWPPERMARECEVMHAVVPGKDLLAASAISELKERRIPDRSRTGWATILSTVLLPQPAPASMQMSSPVSKASKIASCSSVGLKIAWPFALSSPDLPPCDGQIPRPEPHRVDVRLLGRGDEQPHCDGGRQRRMRRVGRPHRDQHVRACRALPL